MMETEDLRLECLRLALAIPHVNESLKVAEQFYDFVKGKLDAKPVPPLHEGFP